MEGQKYLKVYKGDEPYIFVSYSHKDTNTVLPIIEDLQKRGFRLWFDQGIEAGSEWPEFIAERLEKCDCMLMMMSENSANSKNCRNEINLALNLNKNSLVVYLEETPMTGGMRLQLSTSQAIFRKRCSYRQFISQLNKAPVIQRCRKFEVNFEEDDGAADEPYVEDVPYVKPKTAVPPVHKQAINKPAQPAKSSAEQQVYDAKFAQSAAPQKSKTANKKLIAAAAVVLLVTGAFSLGGLTKGGNKEDITSQSQDVQSQQTGNEAESKGGLVDNIVNKFDDSTRSVTRIVMDGKAGYEYNIYKQSDELSNDYYNDTYQNAHSRETTLVANRYGFSLRLDDCTDYNYLTGVVSVSDVTEGFCNGIPAESSGMEVAVSVKRNESTEWLTIYKEKFLRETAPTAITLDISGYDQVMIEGAEQLGWGAVLLLDDFKMGKDYITSQAPEYAFPVECAVKTLPLADYLEYYGNRVDAVSSEEKMYADDVFTVAVSGADGFVEFVTDSRYTTLTGTAAFLKGSDGMYSNTTLEIYAKRNGGWDMVYSGNVSVNGPAFDVNIDITDADSVRFVNNGGWGTEIILNNFRVS